MPSVSIKPQSPYPISTKEGQIIAHEVALPLGVLPLAVPASGSVTSDQLPTNTLILVVTTNVDCYLDFRETPSAPTNGQYVEGVAFVPANTTSIMSLASMDDAAYNRLACHSLGTAGRCVVQTFGAWGVAAEQVQSEVL